MMSRGILTESVVENAALAWLEGLGYGILYAPEIAGGRAQRPETAT